MWKEAGEAILTTDTFAKYATVDCEIDGAWVTINGIAKGSGMIAPDMATMLAFIFTDAKIDPDLLQDMLRKSVEKSFNSITVDGDTSTSDSIIMVATGKGKPRDDYKAHRHQAQGNALRPRATAHQSGTAGGDGWRRGGEIHHRHRHPAPAATSRHEGSAWPSPIRRWSRPQSPEKTPIGAGSLWRSASRDRRPTAIAWRSRSAASRSRADGQRVANYDETPVAAHVKGRQIEIEVDVGIAEGEATVWTCDLTHRYIDINAGYRS